MIFTNKEKYQRISERQQYVLKQYGGVWERKQGKNLIIVINDRHEVLLKESSKQIRKIK